MRRLRLYGNEDSQAEQSAGAAPRRRLSLYGDEGMSPSVPDVTGFAAQRPRESAAWEVFDDGGEDDEQEYSLVKGIVDRASQNLIYDKGNAPASLTDREAVFSFPGAAEEFAGGAVVGGLLGGGQMATISAVDAALELLAGKTGESSRRIRQQTRS